MLSQITWVILDVGPVLITLSSILLTKYASLLVVFSSVSQLESADTSQESYYHPFCLIDYNNATSVTNCWEGDNIVSLPDLRTEDTDVLDTWKSWITDLVAEYKIDGLRVDSAQQVDGAFFPPFQQAGECSVPDN